MQVLPLIERVYPKHFVFMEHPAFKPAACNMIQQEEDEQRWTIWCRLVIEAYDGVLEHKSRLEFSARFPPWQAHPQLAQRAASFGALWSTTRGDAATKADPFTAQAARRKIELPHSVLAHTLHACV